MRVEGGHTTVVLGLGHLDRGSRGGGGGRGSGGHKLGGRHCG